jgi:tetratricopeptide (TPR) repeat protein
MVSVLMIILLGWAIVASLQRLEQYRPAEIRAEELAFLPKGSVLRIAVLGYRHVAADLIWLKAVQYFGEHKQNVSGYRWAYHTTNVVTDLDPQFVLAYYTGGTVLGVWAGLLDESVALLKKGIQHNPQDWHLPFLLGYDYFYELCDSANGSQYLQLASALPGAPPYLAKLAARLAVEAGNPDAALEFLARFRQQVTDERIREALEQRMKEVVTERVIRSLEKAISHFKAQYGRLPDRLDELVVTGIIDGIPIEPLGGQYVLKSGGVVISTGLKERMRLYRKVGCKSGMPNPMEQGY